MKIGYVLYDTEKKPCGISRLTKGCLEEIRNCQQLNLSILGYNYLGLDGYRSIPVLYRNRDTVNRNKEIRVLAKIFGVDLIHSFYFPLPAMKDVIKILTIHDLAALVNINWFPNEESMKILYDLHLRQGAKDADIILADSEHTRSDIVQYYDVSPQKVKVVYPGLYSRRYAEHIVDELQVLRKYRIDKDYILSICTVEPRKNLLSLIKAYEVLRDKKPEYDIKLVLVGKRGWKNDNIYSLSAASKYSLDIIFTEYIEDYELDILYKKALLFAYISYYEGFGLPILEAMSKGAAVLASETSSMPEVGGAAVRYCDPYEIDSIVYQLDCLIYDTDLRNELKKKAVVQAKKFSYKKMASETIKIYSEMVKTETDISLGR